MKIRGRRLPAAAHLAGDSALIARYRLAVPLHHDMAAVATKSARRKEDGWLIRPLWNSDAFHRRVTTIVDMGARKLDLLLGLLQQAHGTLSKRETENEFALPTGSERTAIEPI